MIEKIFGGIILINLLSTKSVSVLVKEDYRKLYLPVKKSDAPHIDPYYGQNQTVQMGETVSLVCKIYNVLNRSVSWVRLSDGHILTVDGEVFTSDSRISPVINRRLNIWSLRVSGVEPGDQGEYECQVSTETKLSSIKHLQVIQPKVEIVGGPDIYIHGGSPAQLECRVTEFILPPQTVVWHHDDTTIGPEGRYSGLSFNVEKSETSEVVGSMADILTSLSTTVTIPAVRGSDAGLYSCGVGSFPPAQATLHVIDVGGEHKLFMVNSGASPGPPWLSVFVFILSHLIMF